MNAESPRTVAFEAAMAEAADRLGKSEPGQALTLLERAHVLGQRDFALHWRVHVLMLRAAVALGDAREVGGQVMRLALTPIGHLLGRLPRGNTGRANVSAFAPMPVPPDLQQLLEDKDG
jgi:hypothetical protein